MSTYTNTEVFNLIRKTLGWFKTQIDLKLDTGNAGLGVITDYTKSSIGGTILKTDTINTALGKLEYRLDSTANEISGIKSDYIHKGIKIVLSGDVTSSEVELNSGTATINTTLATTVDASKITGKIDIGLLPNAALPTMKVVATHSKMLELRLGENGDVQKGDTVLVQSDTDGTSNRLYYVVDDSNNSATEECFQIYNASVDWSAVANKPVSLVSFLANNLNSDGNVLLTGYSALDDSATDADKTISTTDTITSAIAKLEAQVKSAKSDASGSYVKLNSTSLQTINSKLSITDEVSFNIRPLVDGTEVSLKGDYDYATAVKLTPTYVAVTDGYVQASETVESALHDIDVQVVANKSAVETAQDNVNAMYAAFEDFFKENEESINLN